MHLFICPLCSRQLVVNKLSLQCEAGHNFDLAKRGYVNLLPVQSRNSKAPGDSANMIKARSRFLNAGHYKPLADLLVSMVNAQTALETIADLGCGEGYFTSAMASLDKQVYGIDISKPGIEAACRSVHGLYLAVASTNQLPLRSNSFDLATVMMAPLSDDISRILKDGGTLIRVTPGAKHLWEFKQLLYAEPRQHKPGGMLLTGLEPVEQLTVPFTLNLDRVSREDLLAMTPMGWRTQKVRSQRALDAANIAVQAEFNVDVFRKI